MSPSRYDPPPQWYSQYYRPPQRVAPPQPNPDRRKRWTCAYYVLRNIALVCPAVLCILNVNVYASGDGQRATVGAGPADPVFLDLYLTIPLSVVHIFWTISAFCVRQGRSRRVSPGAAFWIELVLGLAGLVCFALMVVHVVTKNRDPLYGYPYKAAEGSMAFLLGLLMICDFCLCELAWHEINLKKRMRDDVVII